MTPAEQTLWAAKSNKKLAQLRFRRQHAIGQFILDFYCPACKLAIEVDGSSHITKTEADNDRTSVLEAHGIKVMRFQNEEVLDNLDAVLNRILEAVAP
jgi:very-short-patch-repair endonuclease